MSNSKIEPFPLKWPADQSRQQNRRKSRFKSLAVHDSAKAIHKLLTRMRASRIVITSNLPTRQDGLPYSNATNPQDPGVVVWWVRKGKESCMTCDEFRKVSENFRGLERGIAHIYDLDRWGLSAISERAFNGFVALNAGPTQRTWREVLGGLGIEGLEPAATLAVARTRFREAAKTAHSDHGGSDDLMTTLNEAMAAAELELEGKS